MNAIRQWLSQLELGSLWQIAVTALSCILCITFHETCHGLMALALGDPTAKRAGRLTLNPLKHIDPVGLLMLALVKFGWAKPVPVDMRYFKNPRSGMALTALAGPAGNLVLTVVSLLANAVCVFYMVNFGAEWLFYVQQFLVYTAILSTGLAVFNLFPFPPLDGSKVLFALLPDRAYLWLMRYERIGMVLVLALLLFGALDGPLIVLRNAVLDGLTRICSWPYSLLVKLYF